MPSRIWCALCLLLRIDLTRLLKFGDYENVFISHQRARQMSTKF
jgi:hypothetical protein